MTSVQQPSTSTKDDILMYLLRQGEATAHAIADHVEVSTQAIRRHLKDLEAEGLIEHRAVQEGMGRPNHLYQLSAKGRDRFPAKYDEFAISLLDTLAATLGQDGVGTVLRQQWQRKALEYRDRVGTGTIAERVARLVQLRVDEGYVAEWHEVEPDGELCQSGPCYIITEYNCAISHIAESFPSVCGHELEMFQVALTDCAVQRTHWLVKGEHRCGYLVQGRG
ncbi:iron-sulfur cluster biosynthesis transcriptional regulator SufR [Nodosilinea sp. LEGE 06152]|uniref:iron-sulfur cluster biosynthesis transcriptional regulator SufR n=1 Tax=Nodosilinea sp. LEGE 06152 TaxID=2777966 RepID=UPI00187F2E68|nr:iron-sulfur cluster biosynthesis transcriptional regulator SufR [Nodosilinea sp. LEGE 06152]MBE9155704.1 iron-sulfur cluster biosynthesis transcriptional regulator SufR [Nodosilinea sp. LEGE 06152]